MNVTDVQLRRNGSWLASQAPISGVYDDTSAAAGNTYSYEVRWRPNGVAVDVACSPASITVPAPVNVPTPPPAAVDVTAPVLSLTTGLSQSPAVIDIDGVVTDDISGVDRVRVTVLNQQTGEYWNGAAWQAGWVWNLATLNGDDTFTLPGVDLTSVGDYELQFWSFDNAGNRARNSDNIQPIITVAAVGAPPVVDTTPAVVTLTTGTSQPVGPIDLTGGATDDISGVDRVRVLVQNRQTGEYWNGTAWVANWSWNLATLNGDDTWTLPSVDLNATGTYNVLLWIWDNDNNRADWDVNPQTVITVQ